MTEKRKKDEGWGSWALIIILFAVGLSPIALILLLIKLFGSDRKKKEISAQETGVQGRERTAQTTRARTAVGKAMKSPAIKKSNAKWLKIGGSILMVIGLLACWSPIDMMIWLGEIDSYYVGELLTALLMAAGGGVMLGKGMFMDRALKRYAKYLAVMGDREAISVEELSRALGYSAQQVEKDLQKMIDKGYFGGRAYLHVEQGYLLRTGDTGAMLKQQAEVQSQTQAVKEVESEYAKILQNIRLANDRIADPVLSEKIDRLEEITGRIFRAVEADSKKKGRIDTFLNYYMPTTQKLLDSYAEFESAGVEGENLRQAKQRIAATMDNIIAGFAHQLDQLYKSDALDVDSDIRVLETMLRRDTATVEKDFGEMTAVQTKTLEQ